MMAANPELIAMKARIDAHVAALERRLADIISEHGLCGEGVAQLVHTRDQARKHQARLAGLIGQSAAGYTERLVEGGTES